MNESDERMIADAVEGTLSPARLRAFNDKVREDAAFREVYLRQIETDALLRLRFSKKTAGNKNNTIPFPRKFARLCVATAAACAVAAIGFYGYFFRPVSHPAAGDTPPQWLIAEGDQTIKRFSPGSAACVIQCAGLDASGPGCDELSVGLLLRSGLYTLDKGNLSVEFDSGAIVHLNAPAKLEIKNPFFAVLHEGRAKVEVPRPAIGFVLQTPTARIEDYGTEFAVNVAAAGETKMRVLQGEVEMTPLRNKTAARRVFADTAYALNRDDDTMESIASDSVNVPASQARAPGVPARYLRWSFDDTDAAGNFIDTGQHAGGHYTLRFKNESKSNAALAEGKIGRGWRFDGNRSLLMSDYPGIVGSKPRTVAFWVNIPPGANERFSYAMLSWGIPAIHSRKWQIAWNPPQISKDGPIGAIRTEFGQGYVVGSTDLRDGQWHHVTSVFYGDSVSDVAESIRHYIDGRLETVGAYKTQPIATLTAGTSPFAKPLRLGQRLEEEYNIFPAFLGMLDEVYVFEGALTPEQIYSLYKTGTAPEEIYPLVAEKKNRPPPPQ